MFSHGLVCNIFTSITFYDPFVDSLHTLTFLVDPNNKDGFKALPDDFSYPVDTVLKSRVLYFSEGSTTSQNMFNGFIANTRILYEEERESRRNFRYGALFIIGTCLLDWYVCIM